MARADTRNARPGWFARQLQEHARVFFFSLGKIVERPGSALLSAAVIGIALAMPAGVFLGLENFQRLAYGWQGSVQLSLFLKDSVDEARGRELATAIGAREHVQAARYLSRDETAAEFRELSGFGEVLDLLERNPLPAVIVVSPRPGTESADVAKLASALQALPEAELMQADQAWLQRLQSLLQIVQRVALLVTALLAAAVLMIVGNTLRLDIAARREEILVMKLVGAPDAFIRRPFLYGGCWLGLLGGWFALLLLTLALAVLDAPATELARLYGSSFSISGPSWIMVLLIIAGGLALGFIGAWSTVSRQLAEIEPA